jgi:hypothetical protein
LTGDTAAANPPKNGIFGSPRVIPIQAGGSEVLDQVKLDELSHGCSEMFCVVR